MKKPELLAPAGSMVALKAAVAAGADAVYLGGTSFGARAYADNFDKQTLVDAIQYCHLYGVKVYLTINTLFRNEEILQLYEFLLPYYQAGLDAVIVQDLGVVKLVHDAFPDLPIHASTQMTITTPYAYDLLRNYGVNRIVPARELSHEELKAFRDMEEPPELEVFVQGALCYCYSGQCLMSSFIGGRSGNRGRCAQPCRLPYKVYNPLGNPIETDGEYLLSPKDLCGLSDIGSLIEMGIDSFKIEGRMKKPEYVAACVHAYRRVIDAWFDNCLTEDLLTVCKENMASVFNRGGFTQGYLNRHNGKNMMSMKNPGNAGVHIGRIVGKNRNQIQVELIRDVHKGDLLSVSLSDSVIQLTCNQDSKIPSVITLNAPKTKEIKVGFKVYRVQDSELEARLSRYITEEKKLTLSAGIDLQVGRKAQFFLKTVTAGREYFVTVEGNIVETASKQPLSQTMVREKIMQLGNTRYEIEDMEVNLSGNAFYSMKELKELRRCGITALETAIIDSYQRVVRAKADDLGCIRDCEASDILEEQTPWIKDEEKLPVFEVSTIDQLQILKSYKKMKDIYIDLQYFDIGTIMDIVSSETEFHYWIVLPPVLRKEYMEDVLWACQYRNHNLKGVVVRNLDEMGILKAVDYQGDLVIDYSMYTMNSYAIDVLCDYVHGFMDNPTQENNGRRITFTIPVELNEKQMKSLLCSRHYASNVTFQLIVYGYQQLMVSAQCISKNTLGCHRQNDFLILKDRYHKVFYSRSVCKYCYHLIYNGNPTVLWDVSSHILSCGNIASRIHFTMENKEQVSHILDCYNKLLFDKERTKGHFSRGVE